MKSVLRRLILTAAPCVALTACTSYPAPKIESAPAWSALAASQSADKTADTSSLPDATWWTRFQSDELTGFVEEALTNSPTLKAAVDRIFQAEAQAKIAGAPLYPSLGANFSANKTQRQTPGGLPDVTTNAFQGNLAASYQVDLFGQLRDSADASYQSLLSSTYDQQTVAITLVTNVITAYLQTLSFRERRTLAEDQLKNAQEILQVLESQRHFGTISDLELAQERSAFATEEAALPALRVSEQQSLNALAVLLGRRPEGFSVKAQSLADVKVPEIAAGIPSILLLRRPDVRKAEADLKSANYSVSAARAARFPSIQLTAEGGSASTALGALFSAGTLFYSVGGSVAASLFEGGRLQGQEQLARGRYRELFEDYRQAVLSSFSDVENALTAVREDSLQYTYDSEAYTQANLAYKLADLRYRAGIVDFETVLTAQNTAFQAQDAMVGAELARFTAAVSLAQALGGGWDGVKTDAPPLSKVSDPV